MSSNARHVVVFIGGDPPHAGVVEHLPADRFVIAADSGYDHAVALGVRVDQVVGDLDSISAAGLERIGGDGTPVDRYPTDKDHTDTEIALGAAIAHGATHITVVSCVGQRLDHSFAALCALAAPTLAHINVTAWWGGAHVTVLRGPGARTVPGRVGETVSLLPVDGPAEGVTATGVQYALHDDVLHATASRGVSNVYTESVLHVSLRRGALLVIKPEAL